MSTLQPAPPERVVDLIESFDGLDDVAEGVRKKVTATLGPGALKDAISGTSVGHALHPLLTDVVIGSFISATALDVIGGRDSDEASRRLIALGIAAYPPTALTGTSDWADGAFGNDSVKRLGLAHAAVNSAALALYGASLAARRKGKRRRGMGLGLLGAGALGLAGHLGGHLTLAKGLGVDQTIFDAGPEEWTPAAPVSDVPEGELTRVVVDETPVVVLRRGAQTHAIHDRCNHRGCSLADQGEVSGDEIKCKCHGSRFSLQDGALLQGPATRPQPAFEAREREGSLELRARHS